MISIILTLLVVFWLAGYGPLSALHIPLFNIAKFSISLWDILIFLLILKLIELLPGIVRSVIIFLLVFWLLSIFGIVAIISSQLILVALIVGVAVHLMSNK